MDTRTAFGLLGISATASTDAVRDAYRDLVKVWHPDRFMDDPRLQAKASERLRELNEAYRLAWAHASAHNAPRGSPPFQGAPPREPAAATASPHVSARPSAPASADVRLSFDTIWRTLFFAGACGVAAFVATAPEGFFALAKGRSAREPRPTAAAPASPYFQLPDGEFGDTDLVSRIRGTWVVVENATGHWLPAGAQVDLQRGRLSCRTPATCDATLRAESASRLRARDAAAGTLHDVEVWFSSPTAMVWLVRPGGTPIARPARLVLQAQGGPITTPVPGP